MSPFIRILRTSDQNLEELSTLREYSSPLRIFRTYRFSPYFRQQGLDVASRSVSHKLNANASLCAFSIMGKCNDDRCAGQHWRDIALTPDELYLDLLIYKGKVV